MGQIRKSFDDIIQKIRISFEEIRKSVEEI